MDDRKRENAKSYKQQFLGPSSGAFSRNERAAEISMDCGLRRSRRRSQSHMRIGFISLALRQFKYLTSIFELITFAVSFKLTKT